MTDGFGVPAAGNICVVLLFFTKLYNKRRGKMMDKKPETKDCKVYYADDLSFHVEQNLYFTQCTADHILSLHELLKITSDIAVEDFNNRCMSRALLAEKGVAILVARNSFRIHKYPEENERIIVHTWEEKSEPLVFVRGFEIENDKGEHLITGLTSWILVDVNARRIMPIKKFDAMGLRTPSEKKSEFDCLPYGKISLNEEEAVFLDERVIKYSDLDGNGHTNNSRYGAFAVDALPQEYQTKRFKDFRINFAKEAMLGQKVKIYGKIDDENKTITIVGRTEEAVSFEVELKW